MEVTASRRKVYLAFIVLAFLAGPIDQSVSSSFLIGSPLPAFQSLAVASLLAAVLLAILAAIGRDRLPSRSEWIALLALTLPQWLLVPIGPNTSSFAALHLGWGTALLLSLAAPLWLGLLSSTNLAQTEVPRTTIAAAILGIGALCLTLPLDAMVVGWRQLPALLVHVLLAVAIVGSWTFARPRLADCPVTSAAAAYLALTFAAYVAFAILYEHGSWRTRDLHVSWPTLLPYVAVLAFSWTLWFWLLRDLSLASFSMRLLATCAATLLPGFLAFGFGEWRMDVAFVISCVAVAVALRATPAQEQPVSLGLIRS